MELVMVVCSCSAIDMISILKNNVKKSLLSKLRWRRTCASRRTKPFKDIHVMFYLEEIRKIKRKAPNCLSKNIVPFLKL
jgi:hypothetical protein